MTLGDVSRTRRTAGNPSTANVTDADITQFLNSGASQLFGFTGKTDWETDTSNIHYHTAVAGVELFASGLIRERFNDQINISTEHFDRATELFERIADALADAATAGINAVGIGVVRGKYKSYPLNSSVTPYRSMSSQGQELVGVGNYGKNIPQD